MIKGAWFYALTLSMVMAVASAGAVEVRQEVADAVSEAMQAQNTGDLAKASAIFQRLMEQREPIGFVMQGLMYWTGAGSQRDPGRACELFEQGAALDDGLASALVGECYMMGQGRARDQIVARRWFEKAVQQGEIKAKCSIGRQLMDGLGTERDERRGMALCLEAAAANDADSQAIVGDRYFKAKAYGEAFSWLSKAAANNQTEAQIMLGQMYWKGQGTKADLEAAGRLFKSAAEIGHPEAARHVADYYFWHAVARIKERKIALAPAREALRWYELAGRVDRHDEHRREAQDQVEYLRPMIRRADEKR